MIKKTERRLEIIKTLKDYILQHGAHGAQSAVARILGVSRQCINEVYRLYKCELEKTIELSKIKWFTCPVCGYELPKTLKQFNSRKCRDCYEFKIRKCNDCKSLFIGARRPNSYCGICSSKRVKAVEVNIRNKGGERWERLQTQRRAGSLRWQAKQRLKKIK